MRGGARAALRWLWRYGRALALYALLIVSLLPRSLPLPGDLWLAAAYAISGREFNYVAWEVNALAAKTRQTLFGVQPFLSAADGAQLVREYMGDLAQAQQLEAQINARYTDPAITDPAAATADLRARRDALRATLRARQSLVEAILEGQVAAALVAEGFGVAGQLLPPLAMHFTEVPYLLVVSPRDRIALEVSLNLYPLPLDEIVALEQRLEQQADVSALIVPLGGIALYPAMITETASIPHAVEVFAHEWLHHYLYFFPLGLHYFTGGEGLAGEARIINETTADYFGQQMARRVLARYYPELLPPAVPASVPAPTDTPPAFDFAAAMHETRVTVDALLAAGAVAEAERYMAERRRLFYDNGYGLRRLNQAFFAFYGGYQSGAVPGIGGEDPIGPAVRTIFERSGSLRAGVVALRGITTRAQLVAAAGDSAPGE
ncbi:MAG: hypothetical protein MUE40_09445 [Anaerolineae bacterium]|nr:hypothetical protein [Anaerolineae bacterium]